MPEIGLLELLVWLATVAVYVAIPVMAIVVLRRAIRAGRTRR